MEEGALGVGDGGVEEAYRRAKNIEDEEEKNELVETGRDTRD